LSEQILSMLQQAAACRRVATAGASPPLDVAASN
jgi:hypothetical protein